MPITPTLNAIRAKWSTDIRVGGIHSSYVKNCLHACDMCEDSTFWNESIEVSYDDFVVTFDEVCIKHRVLRKLRKTNKTKNHIVEYYHCHRSGNKTRPHRSGLFTRLVEDRNSQLDRKSRLCNCSFRLKTIEPILGEKDGESSNRKEVSIFIHSMHTGHVPGSDADLLFLPVHPYVVDMAKENLKRVISTSTIACASKRDESKIKAMVTDLERVI